MTDHYLETMFTKNVLKAQAEAYGRSQAVGGDSKDAAHRDPLGPDEAEFVGARDSFYIGTVTSDGWPYIQHRGGPLGFLQVLDARTLAFADLRGNHQLLSTGNLMSDDRVSLFLMDYPGRRRLKILGHARTVLAANDPTLAAKISVPASHAGKVERYFVIDVVAYDWNCPKYITPRFTADEVEELVAPLRARIAELEAGSAL